MNRTKIYLQHNGNPKGFLKRPLGFVAKLFFSLLILLFSISCASPQTNTTQIVPTVTRIPQVAQGSCSTISTSPTPVAGTPSLIPPIRETDHLRGPSNASIKILVYGDLQNETSALFSKVMNRLQEEFPDDVLFASRPFPLIGRNDKAVLAAQAVEAANLQGKFWEMHDLLYAQQASWATLTEQDFEQWTAAQASALGMDVKQYQANLKSEAIVNLVQTNFKEAQAFGPFGVPLILINEDIYLGPQDYTSMSDIVKLIQLDKRKFTECPPLTVAKTKQYIATLHTEKGDVVIELFADKAPYTVNSFIFLAQQGWYEDITFHRVVEKVFAQTGDPSGTGKGTPGYYVITEIFPDLLFDKPGMVAMVNSGPDSSDGQFFITYDAAPHFDGQYTIFGQVLSGMDVLESLTPRNPQLGVELPPGDTLVSVEIDEK